MCKTINIVVFIIVICLYENEGGYSQQPTDEISNFQENPRTTRTTSLVLSYSTAEYAAPVLARSPHVKNLDTELNQACRSVTGYLNLTNVEEVYFLSGIAPPSNRKNVCVDRNNQPGRLPL